MRIIYFLLFFTSLYAPHQRFSHITGIIIDESSGVIYGTDNNEHLWFLKQDGTLFLHGNGGFYFQDQQRHIWQVGWMEQERSDQRSTFHENMKQYMVYKEFSNQVRLVLQRERDKRKNKATG